MRRAPFSEPEKRNELAHRLSEIQGISIPEIALNRRPSFKLSVLTLSDSLEKFLAAFDWVLFEIKKVEKVETGPQDL
jgi:hypothetical protein